MRRITDSVYVECDAPGCCSHSFVTTRDGIVMIDAPVVPSVAALWKTEIEKHGILRYIVANEPHIDHCGGTAFFPGIFITHESARERIAAMDREEMARMLAAGSPESLPLPETFQYRLPDMTFSKDLTLHLDDRTFHLFFMPGHTAFQTVVYVPEERTLFTGDMVSNRTIPSLHEALPFEWLDSLNRLARLDVDHVVPGHGNAGDALLISEMADALGDAIETVRGAIDTGASLQEAKDSIVLFGDWGDFLPGPQHRRWLNRVNVGRLYLLLKEHGRPANRERYFRKPRMR
jgi:cyclase